MYITNCLFVQNNYSSICFNNCNASLFQIVGLNFVYPSFYPFGDSSVVNSLTCPDFANDLSACSFETTNDGVCASHDYDANLQCFNSELLDIVQWNLFLMDTGRLGQVEVS